MKKGKYAHLKKKCELQAEIDAHNKDIDFLEKLSDERAEANPLAPTKPARQFSSASNKKETGTETDVSQLDKKVNAHAKKVHFCDIPTFNYNGTFYPTPEFSASYPTQQKKVRKGRSSIVKKRIVIDNASILDNNYFEVDGHLFILDQNKYTILLYQILLENLADGIYKYKRGQRGRVSPF